MKRLVFTFGTLYEDNIIEALLGAIPQNFYATLPYYSIFKGTFFELPPKVKEYFMPRKDDFSYLFVKEDAKNMSGIEGRAYSIDLEQELILDHWELYPDWYRKKTVTVEGKDGVNHKAFIYTLDIEGEKLKEFKRVVNDQKKVLLEARSTREQVLQKFPQVFK